MKALAILCFLFCGIFMIPVFFGIIGGILGIIAGIFGAIFGIIGAIFGGIFGAIGGFFGMIFDHHGWCFDYDVNIFGLAAIALAIVLVSKSSRSKTRS